jgi:hypothetical protein
MHLWNNAHCISCMISYTWCFCSYQCRIEITLSLPGSTNAKLHAESIFPLYVMLARPTSNVSFDGVSLAFFSLWNWVASLYVICQMIRMLSIMLICSILQYIDSTGFVCLLHSVNVKIMATLKPYSSFLTWKTCQPPILATLKLSLSVVVRCISYTSFCLLLFCAVIKLFYLLQKGKSDKLLVRITALEAM